MQTIARRAMMNPCKGSRTGVSACPMQITPTEGSYFATAELSYAWHAVECAGCGKARRQFGYGLFLPASRFPKIGAVRKDGKDEVK